MDKDPFTTPNSKTWESRGPSDEEEAEEGQAAPRPKRKAAPFLRLIRGGLDTAPAAPVEAPNKPPKAPKVPDGECDPDPPPAPPPKGTRGPSKPTPPKPPPKGGKRKP